MTTPGDDDQDEAPVQRVVSAADASPLYSKAASSVFTSWRKPGEQIGQIPSLDEPEATEAAEATTDTPPPGDTGSTAPAPTTDQQGEPMAKRNGAARASKSTRGSPQLQICSVLLQGDMSREDLRAALPDLTGAQVSSAVHNASTHQRVKWKEGDQVYSLTATGRAWLKDAGAEPAAPQEKPARKSAAHRRGRRQQQAETPKVDTSPTVGSTRTFRCAVINDGGFWISKDGADIELTPDEHREMLAYLERMAEEA